MKVETWATDRPIPYARNPRNNQAAVDKVAASLKEFGWRQPIVVDKDGVVVAGHTRLLAAKKLGLEKVPVHVATDLTDAQVKAFRLADNKTGEIADWDHAMLSLELSDLQEFDYDLGMTAFDPAEISKLMGLDINDGSEKPDSFQEYDEGISTDKQCPQCGYKWSGGDK